MDPLAHLRELTEEEEENVISEVYSKICEQRVEKMTIGSKFERFDRKHNKSRLVSVKLSKDHKFVMISSPNQIDGPGNKSLQDTKAEMAAAVAAVESLKTQQQPKARGLLNRRKSVKPDASVTPDGLPPPSYRRDRRRASVMDTVLSAVSHKADGGFGDRILLKNFYDVSIPKNNFKHHSEKNRSFTLIHNRDSESNVDLMALSDEDFSYWTDGFRYLMGEPATNDDTQNEMQILMEIEVEMKKIGRVLNLPPIPPNPSNYSFHFDSTQTSDLVKELYPDSSSDGKHHSGWNVATNAMKLQKGVDAVTNSKIDDSDAN